MDALIRKLTNLGYEFFGILLPGTLAVLMWSLLWIAAADVVPSITRGTVPKLTLSEARDAIEQAIEWSAFITVLLMTTLAYFVGHLLTWVARRGKRHERVNFWHHLAGALLFRPPQQQPSYSLRFTPLWKWAGERLLDETPDLSWSLFYPAAKSYLLQKRIPSLVTTYQNKYTLHRSLAVAAALTAWGTLFVTVYSFFAQPAEPHWFAIVVLAVGSLSAVYGFSSSYLYNWKLWGNYLIMETYVSLRVEEAHDER